MKPCLLLSVFAFAVMLHAEDSPSAPSEDRVGFPVGYATNFAVLRTVARDKGAKVVTIYGNAEAASVTNKSQLPYPNGSVRKTTFTKPDWRSEQLLSGTPVGLRAVHQPGASPA